MQLRPATSEDAYRLFRWRCDPATVAQSVRPPPATYEAHQIWLARTLHDPTKTLWLALSTDQPALWLGMLRFDRRAENGMAEVSIQVAPDQRGKGYGQRLIRRGTLDYVARTGVRTVWAWVKLENRASQHAFLAAGYELVDIDDPFDLEDIVRQRGQGIRLQHGAPESTIRFCKFEYAST